MAWLRRRFTRSRQDDVRVVDEGDLDLSRRKTGTVRDGSARVFQCWLPPPNPPRAPYGCVLHVSVTMLAIFIPGV